MPGVRIGFITLPKELFKDIIKAKHTTDISSSGFLQRAFDLYLRKGYWKNHIDKIKEVYSEKYRIMVRELEHLKLYGLDYLLTEGGLSLWVKLPNNINALELYKECSENNLSIVPGKIFFTDDSIYNNYIRISFGAVNNEEIIEGISILESILKKNHKDKGNKYLPFV